jgi:hypothetical protein
MNRAKRADGLFERRPGALHVVPAIREEPLMVEGAVADRWWGLGAVERARVSAFLSGASVPGIAFEVYADARLPEQLVRDLACGGMLLRAAFPLLARSVIGVERQGAQTIARVRCLGDHSGAFLRILSPTGRCVAFDVIHRIVSSAESDLRHRVAIDVRAIVVQLVRHRRADADPPPADRAGAAEELRAPRSPRLHFSSACMEAITPLAASESSPSARSKNARSSSP